MTKDQFKFICKLEMTWLHYLSVKMNKVALALAAVIDLLEAENGDGALYSCRVNKLPANIASEIRRLGPWGVST